MSQPSNSSPDIHNMHAALPLPDAAALSALAARVDRPVVLVGLMGVGKSTIGRRLAQCLGTPFVDADDEVVEAAQMSIPEIFDRFGEAYFRDGERRVIARLIEDNAGRPAVIATGGGAFADDETRALILDRAIAVWLDADIDTLVARVSRKSTRPLLTGKDPRAVLEDLLAKRGPAYAEAPIRVISDGGPQTNGVARILAALGDYLA
jgi:shikimate kinase